MKQALNELGLGRAALALRQGKISSEQLVSACLERIEQREPQVEAWEFLDPRYALEQARQADRRLESGEPLGPLHGVPLGLKDIFDTKDMPTQNGCVLHKGRQPEHDAFCVSLLRAAGAVLLGKTVTAELAVYTPGKTKNPHDPARTPGGSSSGSAAAVADLMIPGALGTQTNGSMLRPASFCGVVGYKPSFGRISRRGVLKQCPSLDQVGVFARSVPDAALLAQAIMAHDDLDPGMGLRASQDLCVGLEGKLPAAPRLALVKSPVWQLADPDAKEALLAYAQGLGSMVRELELPPLFDSAVKTHHNIMRAEMTASYHGMYHTGAELLSPKLRELMLEGLNLKAVDYLKAKQAQPVMARALHEAMQGYDAIITLPATGEAPLGLDTTGDPIFCTIWTLCGLPSISLPLLKGQNGMPIGLQLVGRAGEDARLLAIAHHLMQRRAGHAEAD